MPTVAIIGTGLIGASIGLRLRQGRAIADARVIGYDREREHARRARALGAIDEEAGDAAAAVRAADLVILAVPVMALRPLLEEIAPHLRPGAVVTDTASTKAEVLAWAERLLPSGAAYVGGHPMAGRTDTGPDAAEATLFEGARWVIVPSPRAPEGAVDSIRQLVEALGARPMFMDAAEHDAYVAAVSHLPMLAAHALFTLARASDAWPELSLLAASGFRDTTRLAGTDPNMAFDIIATNRAQISHWLQRYRQALRELQDRIDTEGSEEELFRALAQTAWDYSSFRDGQIGRVEVDAKDRSSVPRPDITAMLLGGAIAEKVRLLTERSEERLADLERRRRFERRG